MTSGSVAPVELTPGAVHVLRLRLDAPADVGLLESLLDDDERRRADRFVRDRDRRRFVVAHGACRMALGECLDRSPSSLVFRTGVNGKPELAGKAHWVRFNLSHAGELALLAVSPRREVGIDIEEERPIRSLDLARRFFSPCEYAALCALPPDEQQRAFFRCWTRKESFIKALGCGLTFPLDGFDVSFEDDGPQLLRACRAAPREVGRWRIVSLRIDAGYAAAVTAEGSDWNVVPWRERALCTGSGPSN